VAILSEDGPRLVRELLVEKYHVPFTLDEDHHLELTRRRPIPTSRILHVNDATGRAIQEALVAALKQYPNIQLLTDRSPWTC
jgi:L-aspartate oxidase